MFDLKNFHFHTIFNENFRWTFSRFFDLKNFRRPISNSLLMVLINRFGQNFVQNYVEYNGGGRGINSRANRVRGRPGIALSLNCHYCHYFFYLDVQISPQNFPDLGCDPRTSAGFQGFRIISTPLGRTPKVVLGCLRKLKKQAGRKKQRISRFT